MTCFTQQHQSSNARQSVSERDRERPVTVVETKHNALAMQPTPLDVVVRFSTSDPDLNIAILDAPHTSTLNLKQRIRKALSVPSCTARLRLIHAGKVLADQDALSKSVGNLAPPPVRDDTIKKSEKARGKLPVKEVKPAVRVYIHCSIGEALSQRELEDERQKADDADAALLVDGAAAKLRPALLNTAPEISTTPSPRGFDRLLSTGFTAAEVTSLRAQFLAIQAHTHTPDTMPTGSALLALEERWLEQPSGNGGGPGAGDDFAGDDGLEDMLWGSLIGFFWPVGVMCWLIREEGVWTRRRQIMVLLGFFINLMFGFLRLIS